MDSELFYIIDFGDWLGSQLERVLAPGPASIFGHVVSWGVNGLLWAGGIAVAVTVIRAII